MRGLRATFLVVAIGVCLVSLAANAPLIDPDEGLHAAIAQEMLQRHDYVTPTFLGEPFLDKPILFFWAEAASLKLFGLHEAAVRLPPLLFGLLGAIGVAALASTMFDRDTGAAAGLVYATMALPLGVSEVAVHDVALIPFLCAACYGVWRASQSPRAWTWGIGVGVAIGLSILTKGLVGGVFVGMFAVCVAAARPSAIPRLVAALAVAGILAAIVAAPWYIAMERAHPGYLYYYFVQRHVEGYLTTTQRHAGREWWYYLPIVVGGSLPWTAYAYVSAREAARDVRLKIVWGWFVVGIVFLSIGESKLATYVLPAFPAFALAVGAALLAEGRGRGFRIAFIVQAIVAAALPFIAITAVGVRFGVAETVPQIVAVMGGLCVALLMRIAWRGGGAMRTARLAGLAMLLSFALVILIALPRGAAWMSAKDLAAALNAQGALPSRVFVLDERIGSLVFYLSPDLRAQLAADRVGDVSQAALFARIAAEPADAIVAVRANRADRFERGFTHPPASAWRAGPFTVFRIGTLRAALARQ